MGSNNQNAADIQKGFNMIGDLFTMFDTSKPGTPVDYSGDYEEKATMMELDARERAIKEKQQTRETARGIHAEQEAERARKRTEWGRSGMARSGSSQLVQEARQQESREAEEDALFEGDQRADEIMDKGMRDSNLFRINTGLKPQRSTLSLGSKLYEPWR